MVKFRTSRYPVPTAWIVCMGIVWAISGWSVRHAHAQQISTVHAETTLTIDANGTGHMESRITYPGRLYTQFKSVYGANPYILFRSLTGELQPRYIIENVKIDFDDAKRTVIIRLDIPDMFRYNATDNVWHLQVKLTHQCTLVTQEKQRAFFSCTYPLQSELTAGELVQMNEKVTYVLPDGARWGDIDLKKQRLNYHLNVPWTYRHPKFTVWVALAGTLVALILAIVAWLVRPSREVVVAERVPAEALPSAGVARIPPPPVQPAAVPQSRAAVPEPVSAAEPTEAFAVESTIAVPALQLVGQSGVVQGKTFAVPPEGVVIGRDPNQAQIVIPDRRVSRRQAEIRPDARGQFVIRNLSQTNPTRVNGQILAGDHPLQSGDRIQIVDIILEVRSGQT